MSVAQRADTCPHGRGSDRYWPWTRENNCVLRIPSINGTTWTVSFVPYENMEQWLLDNDVSNVLAFDCEWTRRSPNGIGLIQFATLPPLYKVLIVDCTRRSQECPGDHQTQKRYPLLREVFENHRMIGFATTEDVRRLGFDRVALDLQDLTPSSGTSRHRPQQWDWLARTVQEEIFSKCDPPMDCNGQPKSHWGLDDLAIRITGHTFKVGMPKHPKWSNPEWKLTDTQMHYAANDVIAVATIVKRLDDRLHIVSPLRALRTVNTLCPTEWPALKVEAQKQPPPTQVVSSRHATVSRTCLRL